MRPNNFDLLRLFAAIQVVYCHTTFHLEVTTGIGHPWLRYVINWFPGVPIFFTISGFLISRSWERTVDWRQYAANRMLRIYPALWVQLAIGIIILVGFGAITPSVVSQRSFYAWLIAQTSFAQFYSAPFLREFGWRSLNGSLWTIPVELGFYVLLPMIYVGIVNRCRRRQADFALSLLAISSFDYWFHLSTSVQTESILAKLQMASPLPHLHMFLVGVLLHRNFESLRPYLENRAPLWAAGFGIFMLSLNPWGEDLLSSSPISVLIGRLFLAATAVSFTFSWRSLSEKLLQGNDISYGVYLYHAIAIHVLDQWGWKGSTWDLAIVMFSSIVLAFLSWRLIEQPAISTKRHERPSRDHQSNSPIIPISASSSRKLD